MAMTLIENLMQHQQKNFSLFFFCFKHLNKYWTGKKIIFTQIYIIVILYI